MRWIFDGMTSGQDPAFWTGAAAAFNGNFSERDCAPAGFVNETDYCAGGREALQRLRQPEPATRVQHGAIVNGGGDDRGTL